MGLMQYMTDNTKQHCGSRPEMNQIFGFSFNCYQDFRFEDILAVESSLELLLNNIFLPTLWSSVRVVYFLHGAYVGRELGMLNQFIIVQAASRYMHCENMIGLKIVSSCNFLTKKEDLAGSWGDICLGDQSDLCMSSSFMEVMAFV
ncbi:hypothetical protein TIFTF001_051542, partial [Ficus carica]